MEDQILGLLNKADPQSVLLFAVLVYVIRQVTTSINNNFKLVGEKLDALTNNVSSMDKHITLVSERANGRLNKIEADLSAQSDRLHKLSKEPMKIDMNTERITALSARVYNLENKNP